MSIGQPLVSLPTCFALFALLTATTACKKDGPEASLPAATQQGLNTGGFLINGKAFPATGWTGSFLSTWGGVDGLDGGYPFIWPSLPPPTSSRPYVLNLNSLKDGQKVTLTLFLRKPQLGELAFKRDTELPPTAPDDMVFDHAAVYLYGDGNAETYQTSARHPGRVVFTRADSVAQVSAGTFEFTAENSLDPTKVITVSAGRFDRKQ